MEKLPELMNIDTLCINTLRLLSVDMVEKAKSGHPGLPLGAAPIAYILYNKIMHFNPRNPKWPNRDRFILSAGHGSALQYSALHLTGFDLSLDELKRFRQYGSLTPGHPEYGETPGVEATTGPLGQGFGMGVGMAVAERFLASIFNRPDYPIFDHYTYAIVSDGDLMEGVASEAASFAGHQRLSKLIYFYDDNNISIDGKTKITFTEDVGKRFEAYGWNVYYVDDVDDILALEKAAAQARSRANAPSLIITRTHIGYGSPKQDTSAAHGEPLGPDATKKTKANLGWPEDEQFSIPEIALEHFRRAIPRGEQHEKAWLEKFVKYSQIYPDLAAHLEQVIKEELPADWDKDYAIFKPEDGPMATRDACGRVMNVIAKKLPTFVGGSADLAASTKTDLKDTGDLSPENPSGRNVRFGVREHAMGSISNGMYQHGGIIPFTGTFLIFSDYMRPAIRLAALMHSHVIFIFSHDSIALGEDGPTHQPVEQLISLRMIPNLTVIRPADANEMAAAWHLALRLRGPIALATSRQKLPILDPSKYPIFEGVSRGGYIMIDASDAKPDLIIMATGSEVQLALDAREKLAVENIKVRVISMPSFEIFDLQPMEYRRNILLPGVPILAIEAASPYSWYKYVGDKGDIIGLNRFGASAPGEIVMQKLGFSIDNVIGRAKNMLNMK
jgi:transketolase